VLGVAAESVSVAAFDAESLGALDLHGLVEADAAVEVVVVVTVVADVAAPAVVPWLQTDLLRPAGGAFPHFAEVPRQFLALDSGRVALLAD